ncbi:hypothetical protein SBV1_gp07 [Sulfolobales Beppu virus 1]|nr:hypothetical protein SBV1_gp07 [Sulfolobales Beppu virus 1]
MSSILSTAGRFNVSGLTTDLSEVIGATVGVIAGAYIVYKLTSTSPYAGALIDLVIGVVILLLFSNPGVINGIGVGLAGYGLYSLVKQASNGALI